MRWSRPEATPDERLRTLRRLIGQTDGEAAALLDRLRLKDASLGGDDLNDITRGLRKLRRGVQRIAFYQEVSERDARRATRRQFLLGLAFALPVGLIGSYLAYLFGWS